ncbi:MAG: hypothetical protein ABIK09_11155 [Pseudomonadota bacterium]
MLTPLLALLLALTPPAGGAPDPAPYLALSTPCPEAASHCLGLALFLAVDENGVPVRDPEWIGERVAAANELFEEAGLHFALAAVTFLPPEHEVVHSKADRDRLGHERWRKGPIHWFVVGQLDNVDEEGEIYGVHWRDQGSTAHRWVILSKISWPFTLPHELGHFFGLSHNAILGSIMNNAGNDTSRMSTRRFTETELPVIRKHLARKLKKRELTDLKVTTD